MQEARIYLVAFVIVVVAISVTACFYRKAYMDGVFDGLNDNRKYYEKQIDKLEKELDEERWKNHNVASSPID